MKSIGDTKFKKQNKQRKHIKTKKNQLSKKLAENADLEKPVINKVMTRHC